VTNITTFLHFKSQTNSLNKEKEVLADQLTDLKESLSKSQATMQSKETAFGDYKGLLKKYVSSSKLILSDVEEILITVNEYAEEESGDYTLNKRIVDRYQSQLSQLKAHVREHNELLEKNSPAFEEIGVDTRVDMSKTESGMQRYEELQKSMNDYLSAIR